MLRKLLQRIVVPAPGFSDCQVDGIWGFLTIIVKIATSYVRKDFITCFVNTSCHGELKSESESELCLVDLVSWPVNLTNLY